MLRTAMTTQATARPADAARRPKNRRCSRRTRSPDAALGGSARRPGRPCSSEGSGFPAQPVLACYPLGRRRELRRLGSAAVGALLRRLRLGELAVDVVPVDVAEERLDV